jgi:hypothetical protein
VPAGASQRVLLGLPCACRFQKACFGAVCAVGLCLHVALHTVHSCWHLGRRSGGSHHGQLPADALAGCWHVTRRPNASARLRAQTLEQVSPAAGGELLSGVQLSRFGGIGSMLNKLIDGARDAVGMSGQTPTMCCNYAFDLNRPLAI